ncbi:WhiB family transcriptional regulator [Janibacter terrae]|uniref:WhiB family transcriptional regulator n=1 Tax=Janibacter terrae TaxID=103817 RepID=UPI0031F9BD12
MSVGAEEWEALQEALGGVGRSVPCRASRDPELWWSLETLAEAAELCAGCPVAVECGRYAVAAGERWGVWAGRWRGRRERDAS